MVCWGIFFQVLEVFGTSLSFRKYLLNECVTRITIELTGALLRTECTEPPYTQQRLTHWTQQTLLGLLLASWIRKCVLRCLWGMQVSAGLLGWGGGPPRWGLSTHVSVEHPWLSLCLGKSPCEARAPELKNVKRLHSAQALGVWKSLSITLSSYIAQEKKILHIVYLLVCLFLRHPFSEKHL